MSNWRKKPTQNMIARCMVCKMNQAHQAKIDYIPGSGKGVIDCNIGNYRNAYCAWFTLENTKHKICEDEKCMGFRKELVDRGYGALVCPTTPTNPRPGHEI